MLIAYLLAQLFSPPPYLLNTAQLGYVTAGAIVGGVLGSLACGLVSDPIVKLLSKRNSGIYEPEFRLIISAFVLITAVPGLFLFGFGGSEKYSPVAMSALYGLVRIKLLIRLAKISHLQSGSDICWHYLSAKLCERLSH